MDIFRIQKEIINQYSSYISSFININDDQIRNTITKELSSGKLWPEPLIQFNPSYEVVGDVDRFCDSGLLHREMSNIFKGYNLYRHQVDALELGVNGKDFIVTSGTGSGKSLTYIGTIFNHLLVNGFGKGIQAVIVYPMNALINSQSDEMKGLRDNYKKATGKDFPITYAQYTGQEKEEAREKVRKDPPDILLTNYMMLELLLTRQGDESIRTSLFKNLKFLVFDELHTYRGRQGSDVALLIRRIKARAEQEVFCIGTSATMVSGGTLVEQKTRVAGVARLLFGKNFTPEQVVDETLVRSLGASDKAVNPGEVTKSLSAPIDSAAPEDKFISHPLAVWLENAVALEEREGRLFRGRPRSLSEIAEELSAYTGVETEKCVSVLLSLFQWINAVNATKDDLRSAYLPFKLHQFISQTGSVYMTLDGPEKRVVQLEPGIIIGEKETGRPLYPVVFSRQSGHHFICVRKDNERNILMPRDFGDMADTEFEDDDDAPAGLNYGYLIVGEGIWDPEEDIHSLPEAWLNRSKSGNVTVIKKYRGRIPQKIYFNESGAFSENDELGFEGWYMPVRLLFDPTSGTFFESRASERSKLSTLGTEGRSTSTTILSLLIVMELVKNGFSFKDQKLLSFTDNRQDAALQSGHFNDFLDTVLLRSAIYRALENSNGALLDSTSIAQAAFNALSLMQEEYAVKPATFPGGIKDNEAALKDFIMYRILYDLRRSWRVILPNLEQCALMEIGYRHLDENCSLDEAWKDVPLLNAVPVEERKKVVFQTLDFIRKAYAISSAEYLTADTLDRKKKNILEKLKSPWVIRDDEEIKLPYYVACEPIKGGRFLYTQSVSLRSALGKYLKSVAREYDIQFDEKSYSEFIHLYLKKLSAAGWLKTEKAHTTGNEETTIYQLSIDQIEWRRGDRGTVVADLVKARTYKKSPAPTKPNRFFQELYISNFRKMKPLRSEDHTGQISTEDRQRREEEFREGTIAALFCSPTMELGINISTLNVVHMRNVPPNPANYAQRSGRAGRSGQSAMVFTFCSSFSPHDRHYFHEAGQMVSGSVAPPQLNLANEELLSSHLHSIYVSEMGGGKIQNSLMDLVVERDLDPKMPLKKDVAAQMEADAQQKSKIKDLFLRMTEDIRESLNEKWWFRDNWIDRKIDSTPLDFDRSMDRWRALYSAAVQQFDEAARIQKSGLYKAGSEEMKKAAGDHYQAKRQIALLCNTDSERNISEFYPYRYFASEGFLPGYNFTRLPLRAFIPEGDSGTYVSRPRFIALREFGPRNVIYYSGGKFSIEQHLVTDAEKNLREVKICVHSGYCCMDDELNSEVCPLTGVTIEDSNRSKMTELLEMRESRTKSIERISCEEEERLSQGFKVETYFCVPGGMDRLKLGKVRSGIDLYLNIRYIPAAKLIQINRGWRASKEEGFLMGMTSGLWKKEKDLVNPNRKEDIRRVRLYTSDTADALYIEPIEALALNYDGVVTMQYALKRAIERMFQVEPAEIAVTLMGDQSRPNIFLYEAAEGSLGILSQFVERPELFIDCAKEAYGLCRYDDADYKEPASYDDLLSYYNQRDHDTIDRWAIKDALEKLMTCTVEISTNPLYHSYDEQYMALINRYDHNSPTELKLLQHLYARGLRLPDDAQREVPGIYVRPDFFYEPDVWIFCDGTPHDVPSQKEHDRHQREAIMNRGDQVLVYYYRDEPAALTDSRQDIFRKVR